jgi:1-acyl-sn-glycerol-3-phosphate acyltransferase
MASRSRTPGAEVIALSDARRRTGAARGGVSAGERPRCVETTADGRPCRNYAGPSGYCRVHEPDDAPSVSTWEASRAAHPSRAARGRLDDADVDAAVAEALAFVRRRLTGDYSVDVFGFDRELTEKVLVPLARPLYRSWWRVRVTGLEHVPSESAALVVANHAGVLPFDAIMTKLALLDEHPARRHLRELAADLALRVPVIGPLARKFGNTLAHDDDAVRLLRAGELVGVWPEGFKGVGKLYRDRYKLQRFGRGGFVQVALRTGAPIIPVAIVGSEEIYPMIGDVKVLARLFGFPYFPITWQFPALGPLGVIPLPSKWLITFGEPIDTRRYGPEAAEDPMLVLELTNRVRDTIQQMLYRNLMGRRSIFF